jgi:hypothetical protein
MITIRVGGLQSMNYPLKLNRSSFSSDLMHLPNGKEDGLHRKHCRILVDTSCRYGSLVKFYLGVVRMLLPKQIKKMGVRLLTLNRLQMIESEQIF